MRIPSPSPSPLLLVTATCHGVVLSLSKDEDGSNPGFCKGGYFEHEVHKVFTKLNLKSGEVAVPLKAVYLTGMKGIKGMD